MNANHFKLLRDITLGVAKELQEGRHSNADEWNDIADELQRAVKLARTEAMRLDGVTDDELDGVSEHASE